MFRHNLKLAFTGPNRVPPPREGQIFEVVPSQAGLLPTPSTEELSTLNVQEVIKLRNKEIEEFCEEEYIPLSNVAPNQFPYKYKIDKPWEREKYGNDYLNRDKKTRFEQVYKTTSKMVAVSLRRKPKEKEFDYWMFQEILKLYRISEEAFWLQSQVLANSLESRKSTDMSEMNKEFATMYGPMNKKSRQRQNLLKCFGTTLSQLEDESNRKLALVLEFAQKYGEEAAQQLIIKMMEAEIKELDLPTGFRDLKRLEEVQTCMLHSIYNVDPVTSRTHSEWFLIPRFSKTLAPSNMLIRNVTVTQKSLVDYKMPDEYEGKTIIIDGYWTSLMDLTFSHPVRWCGDPELETNSNDGYMTYDSQRSKRNWSCLHNHLREEIKKWLLGIEVDRFFDGVKMTHGYTENSLFSGMDNRLAAKRLKDIFLRATIPRRKSTLILFPAFLKKIIRKGANKLILGILRKVWNKLVFIVRINRGSVIRGHDLNHLYSKYWKVNVEVENWGFEGWEDFVGWGMKQWNADGKGEGLIVRDSPDNIVLLYKPSRR